MGCHGRRGASIAVGKGRKREAGKGGSASCRLSCCELFRTERGGDDVSPSDGTLRGRRRLLFSTVTQWYRLPTAMVAADANNYGHDEIPIRQCVAWRQSCHRDYDSGSASLRYMGDVWKVWHGEGHGAGRGGL